MLKFLVKLALAAIVANATWRMGSAYVSFYKFKDAVTEAAQFAGSKSDEDLRAQVMQIASDFDLPLSDDNVSVRRQNEHTLVDGAYTQVVEVFPGVRYPWAFKWSVDVLSIAGARPLAPK